MFSQNEMFCVKPVSFGFSNVISDRVAPDHENIFGKQLSTIDDQNERQKLMTFLLQQSNDYLEKIQLEKVDTVGLHDVVFGEQPLGDFYFSDMISGLHDISSTDSILDFGCSTGRVIRNLRSAFEFDAYGCDPRLASIEFNKRNFKNVNWFQNNEAPPIADSHPTKYDLVFAISVWSHFSEAMALKWFDEFHKLMKKGGKVIFTTHGTRSIYHFHSKLNKMDDSKAKERLDILRDGGFHYMPYPKGSDLDSDHWGMAYISREWMQTKLSDKWKISEYLPGMAMENQDVYVLKKI